MKISIEQIDIPDNCPIGCPGFNEPFDQGGLCSRCPIFNCRVIKNDQICIIEPEGYRVDWAKAWKLWFDNGMVGLPELYF